MAFEFNVSEMLEQVRYAPRRQYKVAALVGLDWVMWPTNERPQTFTKLDTAQQVREGVRSLENVKDTLIMRCDTIFFSDKDTRELHELTEYTGII